MHEQKYSVLFKIRSENGSISVFSVIWLFLAMLLMSLCLDVGKMIITKHELQAAADAGALAGASTFSTEYEFDIYGDITSVKANINKSAADSLSNVVLNRNFQLKNYATQDIKIVSIETKVKESGNFGKPEYSIRLGADTKMFILGAFSNGITRVSVIARADVNFN